MTGKSIVCIRHGESTFNAAWKKEAVDPLLFDAPLSESGVEPPPAPAQRAPTMIAWYALPNSTLLESLSVYMLKISEINPHVAWNHSQIGSEEFA